MFIPEDSWGEADCLEANKREISMWEKSGVENVEDKDQELRNLTKWIIMEKIDEGGQHKVKARLIVLGNIDEGLSSVQTQCPTCGKVTVRLLLAIAT